MYIYTLYKYIYNVVDIYNILMRVKNLYDV